jgi:hypothetical protein
MVHDGAMNNSPTFLITISLRCPICGAGLEEHCSLNRGEDRTNKHSVRQSLSQPETKSTLGPKLVYLFENKRVPNATFLLRADGGSGPALVRVKRLE